MLRSLPFLILALFSTAAHGEVEFRLPADKATSIVFPVGKTAAAVLGKLSEKEKTELASDREVWNRLRKDDSKVKPGPTDSVIYPASGVDFGLPITAMKGAGLYIGVDINSTFTNKQVQTWEKEKSFDISKLFSETKYVKTIPFMVTGSAGKADQFGKSFLRNVAASLPGEAKIESVTFIIDKQKIKWNGENKGVGPHTMVTWTLDGKRQSALLISAPMLSPKDGKGIWWYDEIARLGPSYAVMKRPQGFSFDETFGQMTEWVMRKGGMILSEGNREDNTTTGRPAALLRDARYQRHELRARDLEREPPLFGFDDTAVLVEVFGRRDSPPPKDAPKKDGH